MNSRDNCKIVEDLLPGYIENLLNSESKKFVEEHLKQCKECKNNLDSMNETIVKQNENEMKEDKMEIDHLKKYKVKMTILKSILSIVLIIILGSTAVFSIRYKYNSYIIDNAYQKCQELKELNNYCLTRQTIYIDYKTQEKDTEDIAKYYYKDGKYKIENEGTKFNYYGKVDTKEQIMIEEEKKIVKKETADYIFYKKGQFFKIYTEINSYGMNKGFEDFIVKNAISIRTQRYNGRECYVIRFQGNDEGYKDTWIDKETLITNRVVEEQYNYYYREYIFSLTINETKDEDISIPDLTGYDIKDIDTVSNEAAREYYQMVNEND